jgi:hypothetical protein
MERESGDWMVSEVRERFHCWRGVSEGLCQ